MPPGVHQAPRVLRARCDGLLDVSLFDLKTSELREQAAAPKRFAVSRYLAWGAHLLAFCQQCRHEGRAAALCGGRSHKTTTRVAPHSPTTPSLRTQEKNTVSHANVRGRGALITASEAPQLTSADQHTQHVSKVIIVSAASMYARKRAQQKVTFTQEQVGVHTNDMSS